jgi:hypothetical protein
MFDEEEGTSFQVKKGVLREWCIALARSKPFMNSHGWSAVRRKADEVEPVVA